ncbi:hypothetical protein FJY90_06490 [Candidatus Gottesmanbacteria bacterium]|nr:hypothetical protein [Candidatus Gottesmanbacteria bacterium]
MKGKTPVSKEMEERIIDELIFLANNSAEEYFVRHTVRPIVRDIIRSYLEKEVKQARKEGYL